MRDVRKSFLRVLGACLLVGALLVFTWPLHALASRYEPYVLGVPFSVAWIVLGQLAVFLGLLALYRGGD